MAGLEEDRHGPLQPSAGAGARKAGARRCATARAKFSAVRAIKTDRGDQVPADQHGRGRSGGRRGARCDQAGHQRERTLRRHVSRGDPARRRIHRNAAPNLGPAHQSLVQRSERAQDQARRTRRPRYRHDRLLWLLFRFLPHLPLRAGQADAPIRRRSTACPTTRFSTISRSSSRA